jgi:hypothetical protein
MRTKIFASFTALVAALTLFAPPVLADTEVTTGPIVCADSLVLFETAANNSITLSTGAVILGDAPAGDRGIDLRGVRAGDQLQICFSVVTGSTDDSTHQELSGVVADITAKWSVAGNFVLVDAPKKS